MDRNYLFLTEFLAFDVAALAWGCWEIWSVRPGRDEKPVAPKPEPPRKPEP